MPREAADVAVLEQQRRVQPGADERLQLLAQAQQCHRVQTQVVEPDVGGHLGRRGTQGGGDPLAQVPHNVVDRIGRRTVHFGQ